MKKELQIKVRGEKCLESHAKIKSGIVICNEYVFVTFNLKLIDDKEKEALNKIEEIMKELNKEA